MTKLRSLKLIILPLLAVVTLWVGSYVVIWSYFGNLTDANAFGGMFGAIGSLFSGLALTGLIVAILLQREDLRLQRIELTLQRKELKLTREELRRQAEAQEKSEKALVAQADAGKLSAQLAELQFMPLIDLSASRFEGETHVQISNLGDTAAFDIEIRTLMIHHEHDADVKTFIKENVIRHDSRLNHWTTYGNGWYGISDERYEYILPARRTLKARIVLSKVRLSRLFVLLQFRDLRNSSFSQLYEFLNIPEQFGFYPLSSKFPSIPKVGPRYRDIDPTDGPYIGTEEEERSFHVAFGPDDGSEISDDVLSEFVIMWENSLPSEFICDKHLFGGGGFQLS